MLGCILGHPFQELLHIIELASAHSPYTPVFDCVEHSTPIHVLLPCSLHAENNIERARTLYPLVHGNSSGRIGLNWDRRVILALMTEGMKAGDEGLCKLA